MIVHLERKLFYELLQNSFYELQLFREETTEFLKYIFKQKEGILK